jgi:hypothetical protein
MPIPYFVPLKVIYIMAPAVEFPPLITNVESLLFANDRLPGFRAEKILAFVYGVPSIPEKALATKIPSVL